MLVFISWSGDSAREVAEALRDWLRLILQACRPWMSEQDIDAGAFWDEQVRARLLEAKFGIVCVTVENVAAPWLNYEAGALAERLAGSVCPYLFGVQKNDLASAPLSRLQAQQADRDGTFGLVTSLNKRLGADALPDALLVQLFETFWPRLDERLKTVATQTPPQRTQSDKVDEVLSLVQSQTTMLSKLAARVVPAAVLIDDALTMGHARLQMLLQQRLSQMPEYQGWSVQVTRFGSVHQARFVKLDGTAVIERKLRVQSADDPVEAFAQMFVSSVKPGQAPPP